MRLWRVAASTRSYGADDLSSKGAALFPGRWNSPGESVVYCAPSPALAVLETAAHVDAGGFPLDRFLVAIDVAESVWEARQILDVTALDASWSAIPAGLVSVGAGSAWLVGGKSALLAVPSVIVPEESVVLLNPSHPDAAKTMAKVLRKVHYDSLFRQPHGRKVK